LKGIATVIIGIMDVNIGRQKKNIATNPGLLAKTLRPKHLHSRLSVVSLVYRQVRMAPAGFSDVMLLVHRAFVINEQDEVRK